MKVNPSIPQKRILVVDDEPLVRDSVRMVLAFDGYEVQTASGGTEALELLEHESFDLVITDFNMPGIKGDELAVKIKARWPRKPVIMLTAFAENIRASGNPLPGVDALLSKPFDLTVFRAVVVATLEK
jgi:CheY-like chemotaxis protein